MLAAPSDRSDNKAIKLAAYNYYHSTSKASISSNITCFFLNISLPTQHVTCAHIFQKRWHRDRRIIDLSEINDPQNILFLFKPIEVAFDEGRIVFVWNFSNSSFEMKVLDPSLLNKTVLDLGNFNDAEKC